MADLSIDALNAALGDRYVIERELGRGGMAVVYLARDVKHNRRVALKVVRADVTYPGASDRFTREIRVAAGLQHTHIIPVFDSGVIGGGEHADPHPASPSTLDSRPSTLFYTMPYVEGETLRHRLERESPMPVADALRIAREAALALGHAHERGVIHRDVKPENILLNLDGSALVTDFGIARAIATVTGERSMSEETATLTGTGLVIGTPAYMAPEQRLGGEVSARSDIWSLAAVLHEMLSGRRVGPLGMTDESFRGIGEAVATVLRRALEVDPERRFASMRDFAAAIAAHERESHATPRRLRTGTAALLGGGIALAGLIALLTLRQRDVSSVEVSGAPLSRLAVIPFSNQGDSADAYFADGMADELTTTLANVPGLRVAARSSAARYRDGFRSLAEIGRELGVGAVLEGTVRRSGNRIRVSAQLTSAADELVLWADRFDRDAADVFAVQDEIAAAIATALRDRLSGAGAEIGSGVAPRGTSDLAAYDLYLRGRFAWSRRGTALRDAIRYFDEAIERDPRFARAHAGLAMSWLVLPVFDRSVSTDSAMAIAERSAARSLALDSMLSDAHLALGYAHKNRWRFAEAERYLRNAVALAPDDALARHWYGVLLYALGRADESVAQLDVAAELDPFGATVAVDHALALYAAGRLDQAKAEAERALTFDAAKSDGRLVHSLIDLARGRPDSALAHLFEARRLGTGMQTRGYESRALRAAGRGREADSVLALLQSSPRTDPYDLAIAAAAAHQRDVALDAIERALAQRNMLLTELSLPCEHAFIELAGDPRFAAALRRAGLVPCTPGSRR